MSELVERVARLICETENVEGFTCTCPDPFEPDWCHGNRAKAQARAVIAAIAEWLNSQVHSLEGLDAMEAAIEEIKKLRAERDRLKAALVRTAASLAAAISLLESVVKESLTTAADGKATKMAAPSDKMFRQMLADYNHALDGARKALEAKE